MMQSSGSDVVIGVSGESAISRHGATPPVALGPVNVASKLRSSNTGVIDAGNVPGIACTGIAALPSPKLGVTPCVCTPFGASRFAACGCAAIQACTCAMYVDIDRPCEVLADAVPPIDNVAAAVMPSTVTAGRPFVSAVLARFAPMAPPHLVARGR